MADGVTFQTSAIASPASGTEVATDDCGADGHAQIFKLAISTDGVVTLVPADAANGLDVDVTRIAAGDNLIGRVKISDGTDVLAINADGSVNISGAVSSSVSTADATAASAGLTTATTLYAAGDQLGNIIELTNVVASAGGKAVITTLTMLVDIINVVGPVRAWFFDSTVTLASDNAAFSISDADALKCLGTVTFPSPANATNNAFATLTNVNLDVELVGTSLFVGLETLTTHASHFAAADDIHLTARVIRL